MQTEEVTETPSCTFARNLLFSTVYNEEAQIRATVLKNIGIIIDDWTKYFLRHTTQNLSLYSSRDILNGTGHLSRPKLQLHHSSNSSSGTLSTSRKPLKRESSSKLGLAFDDVFDDMDDELDDQVMSASRSPILTPLSPHADEDIQKQRSNAFDSASPTFTLSYNASVLAIFDNLLNADDRRRLEDMKDEVLTIHEMNINLNNYYLTLLRLSLDCPFKDVRINSRGILQRVAATGMKLPEPVASGPSQVIPVQELISISLSTVDRTIEHRSHHLGHSTQSIEHSEDEEDTPVSPIKDHSDLNQVGISIPARTPHAFTGRSRSRGRGTSGSISQRGTRRYDRFSGNSISNIDRGTPLSPPYDNELYNVSLKASRSKAKTSSPHKSSYIGKVKFASTDAHSFHKTAWLSNGRVTNMNKVLSFFPDFAKGNLATFEALISRPGTALSRTWRLYIGIIAAAEHKCQYYVSLLSRYFIDCGGNKAWLRGLEYAPRKLQRLAKLNTLLAHQPWRLSHEVVQELIKGSSVKRGVEFTEPSDNWSTSEVVLAMCIISYFHAQSEFALACGIVPEVDLPGGTIGSLEKSTRMFVPYVGPQSSHQAMEAVDDTADMKRIDILPRTPSPGISLLTRKRQQLSMAESETVAVRSPDKWLKTPTGSVPASADSSPVAQTSRNVRLLKMQKRRKSFEDSATIDDAPPLTLGTSLSAPGSYIPMSNVSQFSLGVSREFFLSPSSSASSSVDASTRSLNEQVPINIFSEDNARFLQSPSRTGIAGVSDTGFHEEFDLNSEEYTFLPMEDFDWERHACELIGEYVEGLEDILDIHFRRVRKIHDELNEEETPNLTGSGRSSRVGSIVMSQPADFSVFDDSSMHLHHGESFYSSNSHTLSMSETFRSPSESLPLHLSKEPGTIDIKPIKEAVWFYSLRLLGIQKDDYTYSDIKVYLQKGARIFLRKSCERPELISLGDWKGVGMGLKSEDIVLLALLATQARFMGELLYGIKAVYEYRESRY